MSPTLVSLVPSLTETLYDLGVGAHVKGVTRFCVRPAEARDRALVVGGTKDPDVSAILALRPDFVYADADENKPEHVAALREAGVKVHVTDIATVEDAARAVVDIGATLSRHIEAEGWAQRIREAAAQIASTVRLAPRMRVFVPIWRLPVMTMGGGTYMSDLLRIAGADNIFASSQRRYFEVAWEEVRANEPEAVVLPTEPFRFEQRHRAEFAERLGLDVMATAIADGQALTWFGTRAAEGLERVAADLAPLRGANA